MVSLGEAYRALGAGATASYESRAKQLKDLQRQQLLMAALTPLAQGVGQFATDLISAPFKNAASEFYNRGVGRGLKSKLAIYTNGYNAAMDRDAKIREQGVDKYYSYLDADFDKAFEERMRADFGENYKINNPLYVEGLNQMHTLKREAKQKEYNEHLEEYNMYQNAATPEEITRVIKKYNPNPRNAADYVFKKATRFVRRISTEDAEDAALDRMRKHFLNEYGLDLGDEGIAKIKQVQTKGTQAFFNPDAMKSLGILNDERYINAKADYMGVLKFRQEIFESGNPALISEYRRLDRENGEKVLPRPEDLNSVINEKFANILGDNLADEQKAFRDYANASPKISPEIKNFFKLEGLEGTQRTSVTNEMANAAFTAAKSIVQQEYLRNTPDLFGLRSLDALEYKNRVTDVAKAILESNVGSEIINSPTLFGADTTRLVLQLDEVISNKNTSPTTVTTVEQSTGVTPEEGSFTGGPIDLSMSANAALLAILRDKVDFALNSDSPSRLQDWQAAEQMEMNNIRKQFNVPAESPILFIYPDSLQSKINALEADATERVGRRGRNNPNRLTLQDQISRLTAGSPKGTTRRTRTPRDEDEEGPFSRFRREMQEAALAERGRGPSDEELRRRRDYENRSSSEAFGDVEMGRELSPLQKARGEYRSNLREPFQNMQRVASLFQREPEEDKTESEVSMLDSFIDFFIPGAEASVVLKKEVEQREPTSIGKFVSRQKQKEIDRWENKGTMKISGVLRDRPSIEVSTDDPVGFIRESGLTAPESIALYFTALKEHAEERPNAKTYAMKPLTQAMLWTYEALPEEVNNLERVTSTRVRSQEMARSVISEVESESIQRELQMYEDRVASMSSSDKNREFRRQLSVARSVPIETDEDFIRNAVEYLKLQSIFGKNADRVISSSGREGRTTVNDKVGEYYTNLFQFTKPEYDRQTAIYQDVLLKLQPVVQPRSLLAQN